MSFQWMVLALVAVAPSGLAADECNSNVVDNIIITDRSDARSAFSTFSLVWVVVRGKTSLDEYLEFYVPYMAADQFIPPIKSVCKITFHTDFTSGGSSRGPVPQNRKLNIVDEISCDTGRFLMK